MFDNVAEDIEQNRMAVRSIEKETETMTEETGLAALSMDGNEPEDAAENTPETYWGYTNLGIAHVDNHLNIRQEPSETGKLIGKLPKDAACEVLDVDENGWAHIKSGKLDGYLQHGIFVPWGCGDSQRPRSRLHDCNCQYRNA